MKYLALSKTSDQLLRFYADDTAEALEMACEAFELDESQVFVITVEAASVHPAFTGLFTKTREIIATRLALAGEA